MTRRDVPLRGGLAVGALLLALPATATAQGLTWDIPHRGAHIYARTTEAFDVTPPPSRLRPQWLIAGARAGVAEAPHAWRYLACDDASVPPTFAQPAFDDSQWLVGSGEFGTDVGRDPAQHTVWTTPELCLRTKVDLGGKRPRALWFASDHDDGLRIWLNGRLVVSDNGYGVNRQYVVAGADLEGWQRSDNVVAVQCTNTGGAQRLDVAMAAFTSLPPGMRSDQELIAALAAERSAADGVRGALFGAFRAPGLLLQGELDAAGQAVRIAPSDLRDLGWWLATDLRCGVLGGTVSADAVRLYRLGDLELKGRAAAVDVDGWQRIEVTVRSTEVAPRGDSKRFVERHVRPFVEYGFDGRLVVQRHLRVAGGRAVVDRFRTELAGNLLRGRDGKEPAAGLLQRESWQLSGTRDNQDAEFRKLVADSLARGTQRLREQLANPGGGPLGAQAPDGPDSHQSGRLAIGTLALIKGGVPKNDEVVQRCLDELRKRVLIDTYSLANTLMAFEALYAPDGEIADLKAGVIARPRPRQPSAGDRALMVGWKDQLLHNVDTRTDPAYLLRFNYTADARYDNSVHQYGLLGLYAAHLCGIEISPTVWEAAANHLLAVQDFDGPKLDLELVDHRSYQRRLADPEGTHSTARALAHANGWGYQEAKQEGDHMPTWGSMTSAGITGLAICQAALQDYPGLKRQKLQADANRARNDGFAWLARNLTVRCHAGAIERQQHWFYYYLYSLERASLLSDVALIQDRDWYFEGALVLVLAQQPNGDWPAELHWDLDVERNAMAILFLKQSTLPVLTGR